MLFRSGDLHATNSVVVESEEEEREARSRGYAKAYESIEKTIGGNGGSSPPEFPSVLDQGGVAASSADPIDALRADAEALGIKVDRRWKESRLMEAIAEKKAAISASAVNAS